MVCATFASHSLALLRQTLPEKGRTQFLEWYEAYKRQLVASAVCEADVAKEAQENAPGAGAVEGQEKGHDASGEAVQRAGAADGAMPSIRARGDEVFAGELTALGTVGTSGSVACKASSERVGLSAAQLMHIITRPPNKEAGDDGRARGGREAAALGALASGAPGEARGVGRELVAPTWQTCVAWGFNLALLAFAIWLLWTLVLVSSPTQFAAIEQGHLTEADW